MHDFVLFETQYTMASSQNTASTLHGSKTITGDDDSDFKCRCGPRLELLPSLRRWLTYKLPAQKILDIFLVAAFPSTLQKTIAILCRLYVLLSANFRTRILILWLRMNESLFFLMNLGWLFSLCITIGTKKTSTEYASFLLSSLPAVPTVICRATIRKRAASEVKTE